ncbi:hypothetical protein BJV74DRAFT_796671 [Russula compacta]|nr:hypothetical protein BJV74DRAFT_796671 [Russula compacta]
MSTLPHTPESYAAWQELKQNVALGPDDPQRARHEEAKLELHLLVAELQESPTDERLERFCELSTEITDLAEQSFLRNLERGRYQDICIADLQARIDDYRRLFSEHLKLVDFVHEQHVLALQKQIELERRQRLYAENAILKTAHEIQIRRDRVAASMGANG